MFYSNKEPHAVIISLEVHVDMWQWPYYIVPCRCKNTRQCYYQEWYMKKTWIYLQVGCSSVHVLFMFLVFVCAYWCSTHTMLCVCFVFLRLVNPMLPFSLYCPFFIAPSVFSNVYLSWVLCTLCCHFLWIVHFWLPLRYSLTFICPCFVYPMLPVSLYCPFLIAPSVFSNVYLSCVLCTLCCQFLWIVHFWLPLRYSLTFICPVSCVPYVASFSGLSTFDCPFSIL